MTNIPFLGPAKIMLPPPPPISSVISGRPPTPSKEQASPLKSSLSSNRFKSSFDPETGTWSDVSGDERKLPEGKSLHRHAKSVTFDAAPPQVNEYEMATPDLSSIGSNSREGSYDSSEDDDDHYMVHGHINEDDSFDASLEDTDKTPVVGPDDWRQTSHDDPFEQSPMPDDLPPVPNMFRNRTDSSASNGESRPLPPLPGASQNGSNGMSGAQRSLPNPPPASSSKMDLQNLGSSKMSLEERLKLMMLSDDGKSAAEIQRERRMRRAGVRGSQTPDHEAAKSPGGSQPVTDDEEEEHDNIGELSGLEEYQLPPRISRESILRRVNGNKALFDRESDYHFSSPIPDLSPATVLYNPDVALPTTEGPEDPEDSALDNYDSESDSGSVIIKRDYDKDIDIYDINGAYQPSETTDEFTDDENSRLDFDDDSQYSDESELPKSQAREPEEDQILTPRAATPVQMSFPNEAQKAPEAEQSADKSAKKPAEEHKDQKEQKPNEFSRSLDEFMLAKSEEPEPAAEPEKSKSPPPVSEEYPDDKSESDRPLTPEQHLKRSLTKPEYDGSGWGEPDDLDEYDDEPGTPDSVIHHPMPDSDLEEARNSPAIPEKLATIKSASGSKLKTRPSATPADLNAMREARRHVSREIPPNSDRSQNSLSRDMDAEPVPPIPADHYLERHPSFKKRSLTLDLDLGLSLDKDFDRVIEAQKVAFSQLSLPPLNIPTSPLISSQPPTDPGMTHAETCHYIDANITPRKQRGYLMRQNTKLVAASDKETEEFRASRSLGNSPVKSLRPQSWTVEPWNAQPTKKRSKKRLSNLGGPVPPLPGQESNAAPVSSIEEDPAAEHSTGEDSGERGRLFVKVMGVKDLDLPIPKSKFLDLILFRHVT